MVTDGLLIRKCQHADIESLLHLMAQLGEFTHANYQPDMQKFKQHFGMMEQAPEIYLNLVCLNDGKVAGFLSMIYYHSFLHKVGSALINELVVDEAVRGQGIGRKLVEAAMAEAKKRGMDEIEVSTETDNLAARQFYHGVGFDEEYVLLGKEFMEL
jgi:ribosomal protein S18 acetylase RimI-like enzyme